MEAISFLFLLGTILRCLEHSQATLLPAKREAAAERPVCKKPVCEKRAQKILSYLCDSTDPCEDFYTYVCGKRIKELSGNETAFNLLHELKYSVENTLIGIFEKLPKITELRNASDLAALAYQICKESGLSEEQELQAIRAMLEEKGLSDWPIQPDKTKPQKKLDTIQDVLEVIGLDALFDLIVQKDTIPPYKNIIKITRKIYKHSYVNSIFDEIQNATDEHLEAYLALERATLMMVMPSLSQEEAQDIIASVARVRYGLKQIYSSHPIEPHTEYSFKTIGTVLPKFPLLKLMNNKLADVNLTLDEEAHLLLDNVPRVIATAIFYTKSAPADLFNYVGMMYVMEWLEHSSEKYRSMDEYQKALSKFGATAPSRSSMCAVTVKMLAPELVTKLYVQKYFNASKRREGRLILNAVGETYYERLHNVTWMENSTMKFAMEKLWYMIPYVAYSNSMRNETYLKSLYRHVKGLGGNSSFTTVLEMFRKNNLIRNLSRLGQDRNQSVGEYYSDSPYASYYLLDNALALQAVVMQDLFMEKGLPRYINLAAVGFVMGHMMTLGFYHDASTLDWVGRSKNWWTDNTREAFTKREECFVKQYESIVDPTANMSLDGKRTLRKNIADNGGLNLALAAFRKLQRELPNATLPGLEDFTTDQIFFISFAMPWCTSVTAASLKRQIETDLYAPMKYRINVPLKNNPEFSEAFHCKKGSQMRLSDEDRCFIW